MTVLTRDQLRAYRDRIPNRGQWQYFRTADILDSMVTDMADSFALIGGQDFGVPTELEMFATYGVSRDATITVTDTGSTALQTAIDGASDDDVISVATNATYDPITIPADMGLTIRGALGYTPKISGQNAVTISDGARDTLIARMQFPACSTAAGNDRGAAVMQEHRGTFEKIVFYQCSFPEVTNGSAIMLSHHQSISGDTYYTTPVYPDDFSSKFGVIECDFFHACKDAIEGGAITARGIDWLYVRGCRINGNGAESAVASRGLHAQVCKTVWAERNRVWDFGSSNSEALKLDFIGSGDTVVCTGVIINNVCYDCVEGIDADDYTGVYIRGNLCYNCADEGVSVDGDGSTALIVGNITHNCGDGIMAEVGAITDLRSNCSFDNSSNDYNMLNGYSPDSSNISDPIDFGPGAALLPYTPAIGLDWMSSSPTSVAGALDDLADRADYVTRGVETFLDSDPDVSLGLFFAAITRKASVEYYLSDGTTKETGVINIGSDGSVASIDVQRQGLSSEDLVDTVDFAASVSGGVLTLTLQTSGAGASIEFRYSSRITILTV